MNIGDTIYNKFGYEVILREKRNDDFVAIEKSMILYREGEKLVEKSAEPKLVVVKKTDMGTKYFYKLEDIGNYEELTNLQGKYADNIGNIQKNIEVESEEYKDILPIGEKINEYKKQEIINSYYKKTSGKKDQENLKKYADCFGRIDFDVTLEVGQKVKYFKSRHHDVFYITKQDYHQEDNIHFINWRSLFADFYYSRDKVREKSPFYIDVYDTNTGTKVDGIEYDYKLMLKRSFSDNPFDYQNLYVGGKATDEMDLYKNGSIDPFLIKIIEEKRLHNKLTPIIKSIQSSQNEMIRHTHRKGMIVQGCAGSGKTMILLHRISFLLYNKLMKGVDQSVIIVPNVSFNLFIDELAEQLEIDKIPRKTMRQYYYELIKEYQKSIDIEYGSESRIIDEMLKSLADNQLLLDNSTTQNEKYSDDFELELCDFYDAKIKELLSEIHYSEIMQLAKRLELNVETSLSGKEQLSKLYDLVANDIKKKSNILTEESRKELEHAEVDYRKYEEVILVLEEATKKLALYDLNLLNKNNYPEMIKMLSEKEKYEERKHELEEIIKNLEGQIAGGPRGFLRLLSRNNDSEKEKLKQAKKELDELLSHGDDYENQIDNSSLMKYREIDEIVGDIIKTIEKWSKSNDSSLRAQLMSILESIDLLKSGEVDLIAVANDFEVSLDIIRNLNSVKEIQMRIDKAKENLDVVKSKVPSEEEESLLKRAERVLKNRRTFVVNLYREYFGTDITEMKQGYQLFTLLAFYCLHVGRLNKKLDFLFIDEGQDYSESEYRILRAVHDDDCKFEIYGDYMQCINEKRGIKSWDVLKELFDIDYYELDVNYRNTVEIADYVNKKVAKIFKTIGFSGPQVVEEPIVLNQELFDKIEMNDSDRIAIICHDKKDLGVRKDYIYNVLEAKGLEFEKVYVLTKDMSKNEKYVAYSRALNELIVD